MFTPTLDGDSAASDRDACDRVAARETDSNAEIDRVIAEIIREHGAAAAIEAATRMMPSLDEGAVKARSLWQRVRETAEQVQRESCRQPAARAEARS